MSTTKSVKPVQASIKSVIEASERPLAPLAPSAVFRPITPGSITAEMWEAAIARRKSQASEDMVVVIDHINELCEFVDVNGRLIECDICDRPADSVAMDISGDDEVAKFPLCQYCATAFERGGHEREGHNTAVREAASHYEPDVFVTIKGDRIERMLVSVAGLSATGAALVITSNGTDLKQTWLYGDDATAVLKWYYKPADGPVLE